MTARYERALLALATSPGCTSALRRRVRRTSTSGSSRGRWAPSTPRLHAPRLAGRAACGHCRGGGVRPPRGWPRPWPRRPRVPVLTWPARVPDGPPPAPSSSGCGSTSPGAVGCGSPPTGLPRAFERRVRLPSRRPDGVQRGLHPHPKVRTRVPPPRERPRGGVPRGSPRRPAGPRVVRAALDASSTGPRRPRCRRGPPGELAGRHARGVGVRDRPRRVDPATAGQPSTAFLAADRVRGRAHDEVRPASVSTPGRRRAARGDRATGRPRVPGDGRVRPRVVCDTASGRPALHAAVRQTCPRGAAFGGRPRAAGATTGDPAGAGPLDAGAEGVSDPLAPDRA
jgi:hypothetical protein